MPGVVKHRVEGHVQGPVSREDKALALKRVSTVPLLAGLAWLAGCGGPDDEGAYMRACTAGGTDTATCQCEFGKAREELPEHVFGVMVEAAKIADGAEAVRFLRDNLSQSQETTYFQSRMRWIIECGEPAGQPSPAEGALPAPVQGE